MKDSTLSVLRPLIQGDDTITAEQAARALDILTGKQATPQRQEPERYMTLRAVAEVLGVSACSLWRWSVPGHDLGGRRKFRISEVQAYLDSDEMKKRAEELRRQDRRRRLRR
jgi:predicted DNA-binding transcriptional regulator AlpA